MIAVEIDLPHPALDMRLPATQDSLPVVRQALRSLGEAVRGDPEQLEDAELGLTEACANVVEHAYRHGDGVLEVRMQPRHHDMLIVVGDHGRGLGLGRRLRPRSRRSGYGLSIIEALSSRHELREAAEGGGTEVVMAFALEEDPHELPVTGVRPQLGPCERVVRRLIAVVSAQADMPVDRMMDALLVSELVGRHVPQYLVGPRAQVRIERIHEGFDLRLGPLEQGAALAVVRDSSVAAVGSVVERLANRVRVDSDPDVPGAEHLTVTVLASATA